MADEAIRWVSTDKTKPLYQPQNTIEVGRNDNGLLRVVKKPPSRAHVAFEDDHNRKINSAPLHPRVWFEEALDHHGNLIYWTKTPASSAVTDKDFRSEYAQLKEAKARHFGILYVSRCPKREVNGAHAYVPTRDRGTIVDQSILDDDTPLCDPATIGEGGCVHLQREMAARRARYEAAWQLRVGPLENAVNAQKHRDEAITLLLTQNREAMAKGESNMAQLVDAIRELVPAAKDEAPARGKRSPK